LVLAAVAGQSILSPSGQRGTVALSGLIISPAYAAEGFKLEPEHPDALGVAADGIFILKSEMPVATALIKQYLAADPPVELKVEAVDAQTWRITPAAALASGEVMKLALDTTVKADDGTTQQREFRWAFQVKSAFKVIGTLPRHEATGVPTNTGIEITFSHENLGDYAAHFRIEPAVEGEFKQFRRILAFVPKQPLAAGTIYRVTVDQGLPLNGSEERLAADFTFSFETQGAAADRGDQWFWMDESVSYLPGDDMMMAVNTNSNRLKELDAKLYALPDVTAYLKAINDRNRLPWWSEARRNARLATAGLRQVAAFPAPIVQVPGRYGDTSVVRFPASLESGWYLAEFASGKTQRQVLVQVSPLAAYVEVTTTKSLVWVQDQRTGRPAAKATVAVAGGNQLGTTGDDGLLTFTMPERLPSETAQPQLTVTVGGATVVIGAGNNSNEVGYRASDAVGSGWSYLYTDRPRYQRSDTVNFWGLAKNRADGQPISGLRVELSREGYFDYFYQPVKIMETPVQANANGVFQGSLKIDNLKADYYTLTLRDGDGAVIRSSYVYVAAYTKPAYQLELTADHRVVYAGEPIKITAKAKFFEGTPVPRLALKVSVSDGNDQPEVQTITTDDSGEVSWTVKREVVACPRANYAGASCSWPLYLTATVEPQGNEAGDVSAEIGLSIYGPRTYVTATSTSKKGESDYVLKARRINLANIETNPAWDEDWMGKELVNGQVVQVLVTETHYERQQIGTYYDFVNKLTYPNYRYTEWRAVRPSQTVTTGADGLAKFVLKTDPEVSYQVNFRWTDGSGLVGETTSYDWYNDGVSNWSPYNDQLFQLVTDNGNKPYGVGEVVKATLRNGNATVGDAAGRFLFAKHREGLRDVKVGGSATYSFTYAKDDVPNVHVTGVYWNGHSFQMDSTNVVYRTTDSELKIAVTTDQPAYRPGETVTLATQVTDKDGRPVVADLNVNLVDEAFYAVANDVASPLASVYSPVGDGLVYSAVSNPLPVRDQSAAEFGGCFAAGTLVTLADGSRQPIESLKEGQQVLTFADPVHHDKVEGTILRTYRHLVPDVITVNGRLTATPEHRVFANYTFKTVGELKLGDVMMDENGQAVPVVSLVRQHGEFKVYNLEIAPQHTFFANGFYVHNEKGGGPREFFVDTAVFTQVTTGRDGRGTATFKLPDNLTSWRITVQGISLDLGVGAAVTKLPVRLPAFVDMTLAKTFLLADQPLVRLRAFGSALKGSDLVKFTLSAASLGLEAPLTAESAPFKAVNLALPPLKLGSHDLIASMQSPAGDDSLKLPIKVLSSRLAMRDVTYAAPAKVGMVLPKTATEDARLVITDEAKDELFAPLSWLSAAWGNRVDQALVRRAAILKLNKAFGWDADVPAFDSTTYTSVEGTLTLLPYSSGDYALTARLVATFPDYFDRNAFASLFSSRLMDGKDLNADEISDALLGAAASGAPVLPALDAWAKAGQLDVMGTLKLAAAYSVAGDGEKARILVSQVIKEHGEKDGQGLIINVGKTIDDRAEATVTAAWLAARLDLTDHAKLWKGFVSMQKNTNEPFYLERAAYVLTALERRAARPASITYVLNGQEQQDDLSGGQLWSFPFDTAHGQFEVKAVVGNVRVAILAMRPAKDEELRSSDKLSVKREYLVGGQATTALKSDDLVEVRLTPSLPSVDGWNDYRLTDNLPSGLVPVSRVYTNSEDSGCYGWVNEVTEESVSFTVNTWTFTNCKQDYVHYYARVKTAGTYAAEPAVLQSYDHPEIINASAATTVTIAP
jgi:hypothetical protein